MAKGLIAVNNQIRETLKKKIVWLEAGSDKVCKESDQRPGLEKRSSDTK
jgi:hypothetical protein